MVFLIKYSCACVGVNKLSDLTTCTVQIQSLTVLLRILGGAVDGRVLIMSEESAVDLCHTMSCGKPKGTTTHTVVRGGSGRVISTASDNGKEFVVNIQRSWRTGDWSPKPHHQLPSGLFR